MVLGPILAKTLALTRRVSVKALTLGIAQIRVSQKGVLVPILVIGLNQGHPRNDPMLILITELTMDR